MCQLKQKRIKKKDVFIVIAKNNLIIGWGKLIGSMCMRQQKYCFFSKIKKKPAKISRQALDK
jgi:hypothetical protein